MTPLIIEHPVFHQMVCQRITPLLNLALHLTPDHHPPHPLTRPLLGELFSQSSQLEECLDAYNAGNNQVWCRLRSLTAALKLYSAVGYKLLHIQHFLPRYQLLAIHQDFPLATIHTLRTIHDILVEAASRLLTQARWLEIPLPHGPPHYPIYQEYYPVGALLHNRPLRTVAQASQTIAKVTSRFLEQAEQSAFLSLSYQRHAGNYQRYIPDTVSEETLRYHKYRFHTLQSLYDTYVATTDVEYLDPALVSLRGHISVIFHLLAIAVELSHYYERHLNSHSGDDAWRHQPLLKEQQLLAMLFDYSLSFAGRYLKKGQHLCRSLLKRYSRQDRIQVPLPNYRGLHVRPATLISRIVHHYGCPVVMELDGDQYDACVPLNLIRANEKINAYQRRWLTGEVKKLIQNKHHSDVTSLIEALARHNKVTLYNPPAAIADDAPHDDTPLPQKTLETITYLQAHGHLDINAGRRLLTFIGDQRSLTDIALLAQWDYGEDQAGKNTPLPEQLDYLNSNREL